MDEIFLSYKSERRRAAEHLAEILLRHGFSVWFDYGLIKGRDFAQQIDRKVREAKAVVVLWCSMSVHSRWVGEEADLAQKLDTLIPAKIEPCELPVGFRRQEFIDLTSWDGSPRSYHLDQLIEALEQRIGRRAKPDTDALREYEKLWRRFGALPLSAFALAAAVPTIEREEKLRKEVPPAIEERPQRDAANQTQPAQPETPSRDAALPTAATGVRRASPSADASNEQIAASIDVVRPEKKAGIGPAPFRAILAGLLIVALLIIGMIVFRPPQPPPAEDWVRLPAGTRIVNHAPQLVAAYVQPDRTAARSIDIRPGQTIPPFGADQLLARKRVVGEDWIRFPVGSSGKDAYVPAADVTILPAP
jgi:TIR domain